MQPPSLQEELIIYANGRQVPIAFGNALG